MQKIFYKDGYGNKANIIELANGKAKLTCLNMWGKTWKQGEYENMTSACNALNATGTGWIRF